MSEIKLINGDCLEEMKKIEDESVDLIVTDPPYKTTARGCAGNSGGMLQKKINKSGKVFNYNSIEIEQWLPECKRLLKDTGHFYIMTNHKNLHHYLDVIRDNGLYFIKSLVWNKRNKIMGQYYMNQYEYILFLRKGTGKKINNCGTSDIIEVANKKTKGLNGKNIHDTEKPIKLNEILISNSTQEHELVLDQFIGSGSTGIACKNLNRNFIGIELDKEYFEIAKNRIENTIVH